MSPEPSPAHSPENSLSRLGGLAWVVIPVVALAAFIPLAEFTMDPGSSGEWAPLGFIIAAAFWSVCGAVPGAIIGFARALRAKRAAATPRICPLFLWPVALGAVLSCAMGGYGAIRWKTYRRYIPEYLMMSLIFVAGAGAVLGGAAWLVLRLTAPRAANRP